MKEQQIFVTSIFYDKIELDYHELISYIKLIQETAPKETKSNIGGWHSGYFSLIDIDPPITKVYEQIILKLRNVYLRHDMYHSPELINYWFNVNKKYNYNKPHTHTTSFSAVLYLKTPQNSGKIVLHSHSPDFRGISDKPNDLTSRLYKFQPEQGTFLVFPSDLKHSVEQNLTDEEDDERISIAFNFD